MPRRAPDAVAENSCTPNKLTERQLRIINKLKTERAIGKAMLQSQIDAITQAPDTELMEAVAIAEGMKLDVSFYSQLRGSVGQNILTNYRTVTDMIPLFVTTIQRDQEVAKLGLADLELAKAAKKMSGVEKETYLVLEHLKNERNAESKKERQILLDKHIKILSLGLEEIKDKNYEEVLDDKRQKLFIATAIVSLKKLAFLQNLLCFIGKALGVKFVAVSERLDYFIERVNDELQASKEKLSLDSFSKKTRPDYVPSEEVLSHLKQYADSLKKVISSDPTVFNQQFKKWLSLYLAYRV